MFLPVVLEEPGNWNVCLIRKRVYYLELLKLANWRKQYKRQNKIIPELVHWNVSVVHTEVQQFSIFLN